MTRAFVAIPLPESLRAGLAAVQEHVPAGRAVDEETLHLTLLFLGEQDDAALEEVHDALGAVRAAGFELRLSGLGTFGGGRPRTLWIGAEPAPGLSSLQKAVAGAARKAGLDLRARRFVPHVTLARFREGYVENEAFGRFVAAHAGVSFPAFPVMSFGLYASILTRSGPVYEELAAYPLRPAGT